MAERVLVIMLRSGWSRECKEGHGVCMLVRVGDWGWDLGGKEQPDCSGPCSSSLL